VSRSQPLKTRKLPGATAEVADKKSDAARRAPLASTPEVAEYLGIPEQTLYAWRAAGKDSPPAVRVGKYLRWRWSDVDAWLDRQRDQQGRPDHAL